MPLPGFLRSGLTLGKTLFHPKSFLWNDGWVSSLVSGRPVDADGNPLPWLTYAAVALLKERLDGTQTVLEYGSGNSTMFFAKHANSVDSVEHHAKWHELVTKDTAQFSNVSVHLTSEESAIYANVANELGRKFDIILVDGSHREACAKAAVGQLSASGVLIVDDTEREDYVAIKQSLTEAGFKSLRLFGARPSTYLMDSTTFFYHDENCLGL